MPDNRHEFRPILEALEKLGHKDVLLHVKSSLESLAKDLKNKDEHTLKLNRELRQAQQTLKKMEDIRSEFVAICAHDLRSPLSGIMSFLEILKLDGDKLAPREIKDIYQRMERSGEHMLDLINDLLDLGNMESGKIHLCPEPIYLSHICKEALEHAKARMENKDIHSKLNVQSGELRVKLDPQKALQIVNNLLSNAIKFTPRSGSIELNIAIKDRQMQLEVKDSGQGIKPEELDQIFERFQKTSTQATEGEKGSGLGLSIVHQLVDLQHGKIQVKSTVGKGTSFILSFGIAESTKLLELFGGKK